MAKAKKKKRGGFLGLLQQSFSGWKKLAKYAASGKWANDISKAIHRGGAGKRAQERVVGRVLAQSPEEQAAYKARFEKEKQKVNKRYEIKSPKPSAKPRAKTPAPGIEADAQRAQELTEKMKRGEKLAKTELGQAQAIFKEYEGKVQKPSGLETLMNLQAQNKKAVTKKSASAAVKKAIAKVPTKVPRKGHQRAGTKNGVRDHETTVSKVDHQASVAAELLKTRNQVDPDWAKKMATPNPDWKRMTPREVAAVRDEWEQKAKAEVLRNKKGDVVIGDIFQSEPGQYISVKINGKDASKKYEGVKSDYDRLSPDQKEARDVQRNKSSRQQKALKLEALSKDVSQDHIDRAREFLFGAFEDEDDREQIAKLTHAQVVKATDKYHDGGWDMFSRTAQQADLEWEKSLEAKRKS